MRTRNILVGILFLLSCLSINAKAPEKQIPILAWYSIPPEYTSIDRYQEMKDAGFTLGFSHTEKSSDVARALDIADKVGIKLIITCKDLIDDTENTVRRFKTHPALAGYFLRDEPNVTEFKELAEWARRVEAADSKHFCYLNLFPTYATKEQLKTDSYTDYVRQFIKEVNLPFISYDHYPVINDYELRPDFYENLGIVSGEARRANKPFWAFALSTPHGPYPTPTLATLRLEVFSDLAYGAQGIEYFTYFTPKSDEWNFHQGPISENYRRTSVYDLVKQVNQEIKDLSPIFLGSRLISVTHSGKDIPQGTTRFTRVNGPFSEVSTEDAGAVISVLENEGTYYLVIVNRDVKKSQKITVRGGTSIYRVLKDGTSVPASVYDSTLLVDPGDVLIYKWND